MGRLDFLTPDVKAVAHAVRGEEAIAQIAYILAIGHLLRTSLGPLRTLLRHRDPLYIGGNRRKPA